MSSDVFAIQRQVVACRLCPRLVAHREMIAEKRTRRFADQTYWGRAVPSFGDPQARLLIVGLAPAAHGANRTGRMFTGDRSGDWLFAALHRYGYASQPSAVGLEDGLELRNAYITAVAHCAPPGNKPSRAETENCRRYLVRELKAMVRVRAVLVLGKIAMDGFLAAWGANGGQLPRPKPKFTHGAQYRLDGGPDLFVSYHPSQQNTFTGRLTRAMFHGVFEAIGEVIDRPANSG